MYPLRFYENVSICTQLIKAFHLNLVKIHAPRILPNDIRRMLFSASYTLSQSYIL